MSGPHLHIAFAYTDARLAIVVRDAGGAELLTETRESEGTLCQHWQAVLRALNAALIWRSVRVTLYSHHTASSESCDVWRGVCRRLAARIPGGVDVVEISEARNVAVRLIKRGENDG